MHDGPSFPSPRSTRRRALLTTTFIRISYHPCPIWGRSPRTHGDGLKCGRNRDPHRPCPKNPDALDVDQLESLPDRLLIMKNIPERR